MYYFHLMSDEVPPQPHSQRCRRELKLATRALPRPIISFMPHTILTMSAGPARIQGTDIGQSLSNLLGRRRHLARMRFNVERAGEIRLHRTE